MTRRIRRMLLSLVIVGILGSLATVPVFAAQGMIDPVGASTR